MMKASIVAAVALVIAVAGAAASPQTSYMKAAPSEPPAAKSAPAKSAKKTPTISSKCQVPGKSTSSSC